MSVLRRALLTAALLAGAPLAARAQTPDTLSLPAGVFPADTLSFDPFADSLDRPALPVAVLVGRVTASGVPVGGAAVLVPGTLAATVTDADGRFALDVERNEGGDAPAEGDSTAATTPTVETRVEVRFAGYRPWQRRLALAPGDTVRVEVALDRLPFWARLRVFGERLRFGTSARETFGTARRVEAEPPVEGVDAALGTAGGVRTDAPARTVGALVGLAPSVVRDDRTDSLAVRGARPRFVLDGVPLPTGTALPLGLVEAVEVLPGAFPASMASGAGGAIAVTSRRGAEARRLRLDARGGAAVGDRVAPGRPSEIGGRAEGAFVRDRLRIAVGLRTVSTEDPSPSARPLPRLTDAALARLRAEPQVLTTVGADGRTVALPLPVVPPGTLLRGLLPPGTTDPRTFALESAANFITDDDLTRAAVRPGADARTDEGFARLGLALPFGIGVDLLRTSVRTDAGEVNTPTSLFAPGDARARETARHTRSRVTARRFGTDFAATLARTDLTRTAYRDGFGRDLRATLGYGDIDDPRNATAAAYRTAVLRSSSLPPDSTVLLQSHSDGSLLSDRGLFALPGALTTGYARAETRETTARADATHRLGGTSGRAHTIAVGIDHARTTDRLFALSARTLQNLATRVADGNVEFGGAGVSRYDDLPPDVFFLRSRAVGFSLNGLRRIDGNGGVTAYVACGAGRQVCAAGPEEAPARAIRTGAWLEDRLVAGPLALDAGVRIDVFARGGLALVDPYALVPVESAAEAGLAGGAIDAAWVPYFLHLGDATGALAGFRDRQGRFYDASGRPTDRDRVITNIAVTPRRLGTGPAVLDARAFRAPRRHVAWQPRVAASLALGADASLFAAATTTAETAPMDLAHVPVATFDDRLRGIGQMGNPDLAPLRATVVSGGGRFAAGALAVSVEGWMRRERGVPVAVRRQAFPSDYETVESSAERRLMGADVAAEIVPTPLLRLSIAYTIQRDDTDAVGAFEGDLGRNDPSTVVLAARTLRHRAIARLRGATTARTGPSLGGVRPLARWTLDAAYDATSGAPYARLFAPVRIGSSVFVARARGAAVQPATHRVDVAATRTIGRAAGGRVALTIRGENVLGRWNVRRVYGATGQADEDGYRLTGNGQQELPDGSAQARLYRLRLLDDRAYGRAREITVGLRWTR